MAIHENIHRRPDYSLTWEDPEVLLKALNTKDNDRILTVANAGECEFSFLTTGVKEITAIVSDPIQGYLIELKKAAIEAFGREDCLEFLGFEDCSVRLLMYQHLEDKISDEAKEYWGEHLIFIDQGIIHCGKFEHYLQLFSGKVLPFIHAHKTTQQLFEVKSAEDQESFYNTVWKSRLWKLFFTLYFSKTSFGKHPHFEEFSKLNKKNFSDEIYQLTENHLTSVRAQNNEFLQYMFTGEFGTKLPFFLREENYNTIKKNLSRLTIIHSSVIDFVKGDNQFSSIHLGESLEEMSNSDFQYYALELSQSMTPNTQITYWNILSNHSFAEFSPNLFSANNALSEAIEKEDKCFFHTKFNIEKMDGNKA